MEEESRKNNLLYKKYIMKHIILLPTYNESENIEKIISVIFQLKPDIYIKVIDDNSPDGTGKIVSGLQSKYDHLSLLSREVKNGLGKAYVHGFKEAMKDPEVTNVIMMDADFSHDPKYLQEMVNLSKNYSLVIGSRYIKGGDTVGWEFWRKTLSFFGNLYARSILRMSVNDMTGGFNCIDVNLLKRFELDNIDSSGYAFIMELKYLLYKNGASIKEFPIIFKNRIGGESKISNHIINEGILAPWKMLLKK
jgi:dolichol-phosphate mannosyltransferase